MEILAYIFKSTLYLSILYLCFRWFLRGETFFSLNRIILILILILSMILPIIQLPSHLSLPPISNTIPFENTTYVPSANEVAIEITHPLKNIPEVQIHRGATWQQLLQTTYFSGIIISILILLTGILRLFLIFSKSKIKKHKGYWLIETPKPIQPMSLGRIIVISTNDFQSNRNEIIAHERSHIQHKHYFDLLLMEIIRSLNWFNPLVYQLRNDLKSIHEYQVDDQVLQNGADAKKYQLLIIEKCVGTEKFALASAFNHCQIKNRIVMMNKQKFNKNRRWKVAIFLPVVALMLMAFGKNESETPMEEFTLNTPVTVRKVWSESDFNTITMTKNWQEENFFNGIKTHVILMNRYSQILMDGEIASHEDVPLRIKKTVENTSNGNYKIVFQKDINTDKSDFLKVLNGVANAIEIRRDALSHEEYGTKFSALSTDKQKTIDKMAPMNIFIVAPKNIGETNKKIIAIRLNEYGIYVDGNKTPKEKLTDVLKRIKKQKNCEVVSLKIDHKSRLSDVSEIKEIIRKAEIQNVNYESKK